jgi:type I restriction enzyme M protein
MAIYPLFIQHIMYSLSDQGKAAIVVPTGFITAQSGIERKIRERMIESKMLRGVISMPSNIFATTGTNVSILFLDKKNTKGNVILMDASKLGTTVKDGKNQRTVLSDEEEQLIIESFNKHETKEDFTIAVSYEQIKEKNYSFSAGQYFEVKIEYTNITPAEFEAKMNGFKTNLDSLFAESKMLEKEIQKQLNGLKYE